MSGFEMRPISAKLSVSPQITTEDLQAIKDAGFRSIICNRPDGEEADQPTFESIRMAAEELGLETRSIPITPGQIGDDDVADFNEALSQMPGLVLAYCRTGTRSATLWTLAQADTLTVADILAATRAAGYDMSAVLHRIADRGKEDLAH
mgnify:CR=1 FL=1